MNHPYRINNRYVGSAHIVGMEFIPSETKKRCLDGIYSVRNVKTLLKWNPFRPQRKNITR